MKKPMLMILILLLATAVTLGLLSRQEPDVRPAMAGLAVGPTAEPMQAPTAEPTEAPATAPTIEPTATMTDLPTPEPSPEAVGEGDLPRTRG